MGKANNKDARVNFNISVVADAANSVAVVGQAVAAVERSIDGCTVTILMTCGKSYSFKFRTPEEAQAFYDEVLAFLRNWQSTHDVLSISVTPPPSTEDDNGCGPTAADEEATQPKSRIHI
ncbi:hypothetical protein [Stenotrophomonas maltophilia]|jgi:hypothetical protein|uniref:hypothetical protein n=1 Tax=Stenotrophomonas maltophilia TaxID=40324 RepID=UPI000AF6B117|nr:hypothetical protein [Stenotrophomonas maltophilia]MBH1426105.1 hypothetical protein [Stenotrophomonas maltophilia]MBH1610997.1 hypothetical protein [Stenotrophomonas maltophilia]MBH1622436.1 hypothetical protein [Stenotrophomonas maltophilia]MBH1723643.1 hypothetical protein [Stenotrophomonas maltophilia]MBH1800772.1 hypothetical protein [Stenotrophomonas maltophilia]